MSKNKENFLCIIIGFLAGVFNVIFGSGGGMFINPFLVYIGLTQKESHANSICIIFIISTISVFSFFINNFINISDAFPIIIYGILGSLIGPYILNKINKIILRKIFACFTILAAIILFLT